MKMLSEKIYINKELIISLGFSLIEKDQIIIIFTEMVLKFIYIQIMQYLLKKIGIVLLHLVQITYESSQIMLKNTLRINEGLIEGLGFYRILKQEDYTSFNKNNIMIYVYFDHIAVGIIGYYTVRVFIQIDCKSS